MREYEAIGSRDSTKPTTLYWGNLNGCVDKDSDSFDQVYKGYILMVQGMTWEHSL